jgi:carotenoid cleavage dioxygenase-like enzyme
MTETAVRARIAEVVAESPDVSASEAARVAMHSPFRGPAEPTGRARATWQGKLPDWLKGTVLRSAPMLGARTKWAPTHLFDGLSLLFGFDVGGPEVSLSWSLLRSDVARAAESGRVPRQNFATPNERGWLSRLLHPVPDTTDNTNVNIVALGKEWVALTETEHQWIVDPGTLEARARMRYDDQLGAAFMLAHPIVSKGVVTNLAVEIGRKARVSFYSHPESSRVRKPWARWETHELPYLHSFGLTERSGILIAHPYTVRPSGMLWSNRGLSDHFRWRPSEGTRLVVMDRASGVAREHETDAMFVFHVVHSFETPEATVIDLLAYDDASIIPALSTANLLKGYLPILPSLRRLLIERRTGSVRQQLLSDERFEVPQVDWERAAAGEEAVVFGANVVAGAGSDPAGEVVRVDVRTGAGRRFREAGLSFCEPLFVGAPSRTREGAGLLLTVGSSRTGSVLFLLDAETLEVRAHAAFDVPMPMGFHGSFIPG